MSESDTHSPSVPTPAPQQGMYVDPGVIAMFWAAMVVTVVYAVFAATIHLAR